MTRMDDPDCLFCRIVRGDAEAARVVETDDVLVFLDIRPLFKGHALIVPRQHVVTLADLPGSLVEPLFTMAQRVAAGVVEAFGAQGSFVAMNNVVSQSVPHLHVHVAPRTKGDGLRGFFWPRKKYDDEAEAQEHAVRLRAALV